jgi:Uma2 family endonuclease
MPTKRAVTVYQAGQSPRTLGEADMLSGEEVLPGFQRKVSDLFR